MHPLAQTSQLSPRRKPPAPLASQSLTCSLDYGVQEVLYHVNTSHRAVWPGRERLRRSLWEQDYYQSSGSFCSHISHSGGGRVVKSLEEDLGPGVPYKGASDRRRVQTQKGLSSPPLFFCQEDGFAPCLNVISMVLNAFLIIPRNNTCLSG